MKSTVHTGINYSGSLFGEGLSRTKKGAILLRKLVAKHGIDTIDELRRKQITPTKIAKILEMK